MSPRPYTLEKWHELDYRICGLWPPLGEIVRWIIPFFASTWTRNFFRVPPCHPYTQKFFFVISIIVGRGIMLLLRLSQGISSGCHHATSTHNFLWNCHYCGEGELCFWFDLAKVFLQGATMPQLHTFFSNCHYCGKGALCFCLDLARYFFRLPPCHPYNQFFWNCRYCGKVALYFCFDLAKEFLQGATMPPLHPFFYLSLSVERNRYSQGISSRCHNATPTP